MEAMNILMVYVCNIKASANTIRHKSNTNFDIDDFINRLLISQKFDELAEKVADKAAKKIKGIDKPVLRLERFIAASNDTLQDSYREISNKDFEKETSFNTNNFRNENPQSTKLGKINTEAVMKKEAIEQSDNLRLKYKYLTRNAYEKKLHKDRTPANAQKSDVHNFENGVDSLKQNIKLEMKKQQQQQDSNTEDHIFNQDATEANVRNSNVYEEDVRSRYGNRGKGRDDDDPQRNSHNIHTEVDYRIDDNTKMEHSLEDGPRRIPINERGRSNVRPKFKSAANTKMSVREGREQEMEEATKSSSSSEEELKELENQENEKKSSENSKEEEAFKESKEQSENSDRSERLEEEAENDDGPLFRANDKDEPNVEDNKVTSDYQGHPEEVKAEEIYGSTNKPILRKEGNKVYAFREGSDYEEYHEQFAKLQKAKENNPVFPIL